jgi:hypothetical protein
MLAPVAMLASEQCAESLTVINDAMSGARQMMREPVGVPFDTSHGFVLLVARVVAPGKLSPSSDPARTPGYGERMPLLVESDASEFPQEMVASMRGQLRLRGQDVCNRPAFVLLVRGCKKGVDVARMRPGDHRCHA